MWWYNKGFYEVKPNENAIEISNEEYDNLMSSIGDGAILEELNGKPVVHISETVTYNRIKNEIEELKQNLANTDYKAIKFTEGLLTEEEYAPIRAERQGWRDKINELEQKIQ